MKTGVNIALDIGTTTLEAALLRGREILCETKCRNEQRKFGLDVMSRLTYCQKNGVAPLRDSVINRVNDLICEMLVKAQVAKADCMYIAGNTVMLHFFYGEDCSGLFAYPYRPAFLSKDETDAGIAGIKNVDRLVCVPCISPFVGADTVSGLTALEKPENGRFNLLVDLGTNAEIVLFSENRFVCTSAAAGPCFEGGGISCGMSAGPGSVSSYDSDGTFEVIGNTEPKGICATGLIDILAYLLNSNLLDETGRLSDECFYITKQIKITQNDVRNFQLAKSAVYTGISSLLNKEKISCNDVGKLYIAGGFSDKMNIANACKLGLFPKGLAEKAIFVNNSCLTGLKEMAAFGLPDFEKITNAETIDLSQEPSFVTNYTKNLSFVKNP